MGGIILAAGVAALLFLGVTKKVGAMSDADKIASSGVDSATAQAIKADAFQQTLKRVQEQQDTISRLERAPDTGAVLTDTRTGSEIATFSGEQVQALKSGSTVKSGIETFGIISVGEPTPDRSGTGIVSVKSVDASTSKFTLKAGKGVDESGTAFAAFV